MTREELKRQHNLMYSVLLLVDENYELLPPFLQNAVQQVLRQVTVGNEWLNPPEDTTEGKQE